MKTLRWADYLDKTLGCWMGKNAGGTLGGPDEGKLGPLELTWYPKVQAGGIPNDDLEIQLVWLHALETRGIHLTAEDLAAEWLDHYLPNWDEYGFAKTNLRRGLLPPLSGTFNNWFRESMGCPIRSEIWACVAPGLPFEAARMAREDAMVDHGSESVFAEMFFAVIESMAFVESDRETLVDYGLAAIPDDCRTARAIRAMRRAFARTGDWKETRQAILDEVGNDSNFTDAPQNIAFTILGWYSSPDDFGQAICDAVNCGYDTDCTGATLGSILGITGGASSLPEKWMSPLGREIAIDGIRTRIHDAPKTVDDLTDRTAAQAIGFFAGRGLVFGPGRTIVLDPPTPAALRERIREAGWWNPPADTMVRHNHHGSAVIRYLDGPVLSPERVCRVEVRILNRTERSWEGVVKVVSTDGSLDVEGPQDSFEIPPNGEGIVSFSVRRESTETKVPHLEVVLSLVTEGMSPWVFPISFVLPQIWKMKRVDSLDWAPGMAEPNPSEGIAFPVDGNAIPFVEEGNYVGTTRILNPSRHPREVRICAPSLSRMRLWLNGSRIMDNPGADRIRPTYHGRTPGQYEAGVLNPGWNRLSGAWDIRSERSETHLFFTTPGGSGFGDLVLHP